MAHPLDTDRFWNKVMKTDTDDGISRCWFWTGAKTMDGYGRTYYRGYAIPAHRVSYEIANGSIPYGMFVLHSCNIRDCVNPAHLYLGESRRAQNHQQEEIQQQTSFLQKLNDYNAENGEA